MKRFYIYCMLTILLGSPLFAQTSIVPQSVIGAFHQKFAQAEFVEWKKSVGSFGVNFFYNGHYYSAKFSKDSRLIEVRRNLSSFELPILLQYSLEHYMDKYWISSVSSVERPAGQLEFDVVLESATHLIVMRSIYNRWEVRRNLIK